MPKSNPEAFHCFSMHNGFVVTGNYACAVWIHGDSACMVLRSTCMCCVPSKRYGTSNNMCSRGHKHAWYANTMPAGSVLAAETSESHGDKVLPGSAQASISICCKAGRQHKGKEYLTQGISDYTRAATLAMIMIPIL